MKDLDRLAQKNIPEDAEFFALRAHPFFEDLIDPEETVLDFYTFADADT